MLGLLSAASGVLGQAGGLAGALDGGGGDGGGPATSSVSQTFSTGAFATGGDSNTIIVAIVIVIGLWLLVTGGKR